MFKFSLQIKGNVTRNLNIITHGSLSISSERSISSNFDWTELVSEKIRRLIGALSIFLRKQKLVFKFGSWLYKDYS